MLGRPTCFSFLHNACYHYSIGVSCKPCSQCIIHLARCLLPRYLPFSFLRARSRQTKYFDRRPSHLFFSAEEKRKRRIKLVVIHFRVESLYYYPTPTLPSIHRFTPTRSATAFPHATLPPSTNPSIILRTCNDNFVWLLLPLCSMLTKDGAKFSLLFLAVCLPHHSLSSMCVYFHILLFFHTYYNIYPSILSLILMIKLQKPPPVDQNHSGSGASTRRESEGGCGQDE